MWACLCFCGASVSPLICRDSAVRRKADSCACATLTSPAYMNSTNARRWWNATSRRNKIGCLHGLLWKEFTNNTDLTNCMVHSHSWEGQSYSGSQEMCYYEQNPISSVPCLHKPHIKSYPEPKESKFTVSHLTSVILSYRVFLGLPTEFFHKFSW